MSKTVMKVTADLVDSFWVGYALPGGGFAQLGTTPEGDTPELAMKAMGDYLAQHLDLLKLGKKPASQATIDVALNRTDAELCVVSTRTLIYDNHSFRLWENKVQSAGPAVIAEKLAQLVVRALGGQINTPAPVQQEQGRLTAKPGQLTRAQVEAEGPRKVIVREEVHMAHTGKAKNAADSRATNESVGDGPNIDAIGESIEVIKVQRPVLDDELEPKVKRRLDLSKMPNLHAAQEAAVAMSAQGRAAGVTVEAGGGRRAVKQALPSEGRGGTRPAKTK